MTEAQTDDNQGSFWASKRTIAALAVVGIVLVLAVVVLVLPALFGSNGSADGQGAAQTEQDQTHPSTTPAGTCQGLSDNDATTLTEGSLEDTQWELSGAVALPRSPQWGPLEVTDGVPSCFAKTPEGATLAATRFSLSSLTDDYPQVVEDMAVEDENRDELLELIENNEAGADAGTQDPELQVAGARVESFDKDAGTATVAVVYEIGSQVQGVPVQQLGRESWELVWQDGDWKVRVPNGAQTNAAALDSLDGFTEWSGFDNG